MLSFQEMKAFWMPSKTPEAQRLLEKPDMSTYCPASGKKLRLKDLIPIRFTRCAEDEEGFAKDPVTKDTFTNANRLVVIKSTGTVLPILAWLALWSTTRAHQPVGIMACSSW